MSERRIQLHQGQTTSGGGGCCSNATLSRTQPVQTILRMPYDYLFKLLLIGDAGAGKTSLPLRFADDAFSQSYITTIGIDFKIKTIELDGKTIKLQIWDTAGGERFCTITSSYFRGTHGILLLYDITNENSFFNAFGNWFHQIHNMASNSCVAILVGTKCDLKDQRVVDYETAKEIADQHEMYFFETSSKDNINVEEAFIRLVAEVKRQIDDTEVTNTVSAR